MTNEERVETARAIVEASKAYRDTKADLQTAREQLKQAIQTGHAEGLRAEELVELTGFSRRWVFEFLDRHGVWANRQAPR